jgi:hypothetical protein
MKAVILLEVTIDIEDGDLEDFSKRARHLDNTICELDDVEKVIIKGIRTEP